MPVSDVDELICAVLRGENAAWQSSEAPGAVAAFHQRADLHGVNAMLHDRLAGSDWPAEVLQRLRANAIQLAMWELRHQQVLAHALQELHRIGIQPVLIKGTALAYSLYPDPALRTRGDTDLIIPMDAREQVQKALVSMGFERGVGVSGEFVSYQASYSQSVDGSSHTLDLHWKINNSELLSRLFTYEELRRDAVPLPALCSHALGASRTHALLLACMHRSTHKQIPYYVSEMPHCTADRLIWLYDIHLLASQLTLAEWEDFNRLATGKGLRAVCLEGMQHARECFDTRYPAAMLTSLAAKGPAEPAARYLDASRLRRLWMDFVALGSIASQIGFARETLFPTADYMRAKYPHQQRLSLPWLYLRRALDAVTRRLPRRPSDS